MVKRGMVATIQKLEAHAYVSKQEWREMYGEDNNHFTQLNNRWDTLYMTLKACKLEPDYDLRRQIFNQDIKGRGLVIA
tara:strand:+ start:274 stop:507 length:234 start_codon:yes stop_codon:yes gene_type:complete